MSPQDSRFSLRLAVAAGLLGWQMNAAAADADPDTSFSGDGLYVHAQGAFGNQVIVLNGMTVDAEGRILVVGEAATDSSGTNYTSFIARFLANGTPDPDFGENGSIVENVDTNLRDVASEVLVQNDGKIVMAGQTTPGNSGQTGNFYVVRYLENGDLDASFASGGGIVINYTNANEALLGMALRADGRIVLAGSTNSDGAVNSIFVQLTANGALDPSFGGGDGLIVHALNTTDTDLPSGIDLTADGKIVFTGNHGSSTATNTLVGRLNADGSLDTTFAAGIGYKVITTLNSNLRDFGDEVVVLPDGSMVVAVTVDTSVSNRASLGALKLSSNGTIDSEFGDNGVRLIAPDTGTDISIFNASEILRDPSDRLLLIGAQAQMSDEQPGGFLSQSTKAVIARLTADGELDNSFDGEDGITRQTLTAVSVYPRVSTLQGDGKLLIAGRARAPITGGDYSSMMLARFAGDTAAIDVTPEPFDLGSVSDVELSSVQQSSLVTITGLSDGVQVPLRISNGEYQLDSGSYTSTSAWVSNGAQIRVRHTASALGSSTTETVLSVGGLSVPFNGGNLQGDVVSASFTSTTRNVDTTPAAFSFTSVSDTALDSWVISNTITVSEISYATPISISNGEYSIDCGTSFTSNAGTVEDGDTVCVRQRTASTTSTSKTTTLTIGTVSADFVTTTTSSVDTSPDDFSFTAQTNVARVATITSNTITVTGINAPTPISVSGSGGYSIGCTETTVNTAGTISAGDTVCLRHLASSNYASQVSTTLTIGGKTATFTSTTVSANVSDDSDSGGGGGSVGLMLLAVLAMTGLLRQRMTKRMAAGPLREQA